MQPIVRITQGYYIDRYGKLLMGIKEVIGFCVTSENYIIGIN